MEAHRPGISGAQHREICSVDGYLLVYACEMMTETYQHTFVVVIKVALVSSFLSIVFIQQYICKTQKVKICYEFSMGECDNKAT